MRAKKLLIPAIITIIMISVFALYMMVFVHTFSDPFIPRILGVAAMITLIGASIYALYQRIKEIRRGEEDDLSKY